MHSFFVNYEIEILKLNENCIAGARYWNNEPLIHSTGVKNDLLYHKFDK